MNEPQEANHDHCDQAPKALADALARLGGPVPAVPLDVDRAILAAAREHLNRQRRWYRLWWIGSAAAAAAMVMLALQLYRGSFGQPAVPLTARMHAADLSQRVTILDAYRLAKLLDAGKTPGPEWDANSDGVADRADVQSIAQAAVKVGVAQ